MRREVEQVADDEDGATDLTRGARFGIGVVAAAAAVLSFSSLAELAHATGYRAQVGFVQVAWLLPVALDAAAGVSTFVWLRARRPEVVALARRLAWSTIGLSVVGNGTQHALQATDSRPGWLIAVAVGATAPAVFGAVVHLAVVASSPRSSSTASRSSTPPASQESGTPSDAAPDARSWGGPEAVDAPAASAEPVSAPDPAPVPDPTPARVTPMRRTTRGLTGRPMEHAPGWSERMIVAVLPSDVKPASDKGVRLRAAALTPKVTQAGKRHTDLRHEVERAELARARADDEEPEAVGA